VLRVAIKWLRLGLGDDFEVLCGVLVAFEEWGWSCFRKVGGAEFLALRREDSCTAGLGLGPVSAAHVMVTMVPAVAAGMQDMHANEIYLDIHVISGALLM
jgi:hypothetical protein